MWMLPGPSMEPTLREGDIVLARVLRPRGQELTPTLPVIAVQPDQPNKLICKRIASVYPVPEATVTLLGDNTANSIDSRHYGPIPFGLLRARVTHIVWPPSRIRSLTPPPQSNLISNPRN